MQGIISAAKSYFQSKNFPCEDASNEKLTVLKPTLECIGRFYLAMLMAEAGPDKTCGSLHINGFGHVHGERKLIFDKMAVIVNKGLRGWGKLGTNNGDVWFLMLLVDVTDEERLSRIFDYVFACCICIEDCMAALFAGLPEAEVLRLATTFWQWRSKVDDEVDGILRSKDVEDT